MNKLHIIFISLMLLVTSSLALDKIYFLPQDSEKVQKDIIKLIKESEKSIDIAMYNFTYKKFNKAIKKASKKGVAVTLIYSKSKLKFYKKIELIKTQRKQHIKLAIIDNKFAIYGSANWKAESFDKNYEIINITDDKHRVQRFIQIFKKLKEEN